MLPRILTPLITTASSTFNHRYEMCEPKGEEKHTITFSFILRGVQVGRPECLHRGGLQIQLICANCVITSCFWSLKLTVICQLKFCEADTGFTGLCVYSKPSTAECATRVLSCPPNRMNSAIIENLTIRKGLSQPFVMQTTKYFMQPRILIGQSNTGPDSLVDCFAQTFMIPRR